MAVSGSRASPQILAVWSDHFLPIAPERAGIGKGFPKPIATPSGKEHQGYAIGPRGMMWITDRPRCDGKLVESSVFHVGIAGDVLQRKFGLRLVVVQIQGELVGTGGPESRFLLQRSGASELTSLRPVNPLELGQALVFAHFNNLLGYGIFD